MQKRREPPRSIFKLVGPGLVTGAADDVVAAEKLELPVGKSTCSHHLKTLSGAGVIAEREEGVHKHLRLRREELDRSFPGLIDSVLRGVQAREPSRS